MVKRLLELLPKLEGKNAEYDIYVDKYKNYVREGQPQGPP